MTKVIEIFISPKGEVRIETKGFTGGSCREASKFLEQALGVQTSEKLTAEFYQTEAQPQTIQQGGAK